MAGLPLAAAGEMTEHSRQRKRIDSLRIGISPHLAKVRLDYNSRLEVQRARFDALLIDNSSPIVLCWAKNCCENSALFVVNFVDGVRV